MKMWFISVCFSLCSLAFAFDLTALENSKGALEGAIDGAFDSSGVSVLYLPDYGVNFDTLDLFEGTTSEETVVTIKNLLTALGGTLQGIEQDDWISVTYELSSFEVSYKLLVRMKQNQPETLEVYVNGVKQ